MTYLSVKTSIFRTAPLFAVEIGCIRAICGFFVYLRAKEPDQVPFNGSRSHPVNRCSGFGDEAVSFFGISLFVSDSARWRFSSTPADLRAIAVLWNFA